jgi:uncharacterized protein YjbJ (UPF0337 family)
MQDVISGSWNQVRPLIKSWWNQLTDADLDSINGNYEVLVSLLMEKYEYSEEQAKNEINQRLGEFERQHRAAVGF